MENLISTIIFILPGFMMYFWVQMMGVNPVVKHTTIEFGALSALAWFPVAFASLGIMSLYHDPIVSLDEIKNAANSIRFLVEFTAISIVTSFLISVLYVTIIYPVQRYSINKIRISIKKTPLSKSASVWEEVFFNDKPLIVGVSKFGSSEPDVFGNIEKVARPFEPKRTFKLIYMEYVELIIKKYNVPVKEIFTDIDSGVNVFIYDYEAYQAADQKERKEPEYIQTPSRSSTS
ncbi:hypothetical protein EBB07_03530 [Paenibacillaceae bacterium]|nr:hypothetical protein EBB07_03530 [Paenibacillaceae bacterium]